MTEQKKKIIVYESYYDVVLSSSIPLRFYRNVFNLAHHFYSSDYLRVSYMLINYGALMNYDDVDVIYHRISNT